MLKLATFGSLLLAAFALRAGAGPLDGLDKPQEGQSQRSSSADLNWQDGNGDARPIPPGETLTIAELAGPGRINHIWFTIAADDPYYGRSVTLRMYWDDEQEPGVESPLGDFFAAGHGLRTPLNSLPVQVSSEGRAYNCYWPMPFHRSARITVTNDSETRRVHALFWYIDWIKLPALPEKTPTFLAQYRQEYPCAGGKDFLILDAEGEGHYVGTVLSVHMNSASWFGEGDDRFYIDGEAEPSLRGTGTEDYFCDAWGFRQFNNPFYGVSIWEGYDTDDHGTAYRWHIADPVPFKKSLRVTIEHKGVSFHPVEIRSPSPLDVPVLGGAKVEKAAGDTAYLYEYDGDRVRSGFEERPDNLSSVAFWYQTGKAKRFAALPPAAERLALGTTIEAETLLEKAKGTPAGGLEAQKGEQWSGGSQLFFHPPAGEGAPVLEIPFEVEDTGRYVVKLLMSTSWDYGRYQIALDGKTLVEGADFYGTALEIKPQKLGVQTLERGTHTITLTYGGSNAESKVKGSGETGRYLGVDAIYLRKVPARSVRAVKQQGGGGRSEG